MQQYNDLASPVLGATAAVAIGAAYMLYRQSSKRGTHAPVKKKEGNVQVKDVQATEERKRDLYRFFKSDSIFLKSRGGEVLPFRSSSSSEPELVLRDLVRQLPKGTDIDALVYALSTSLGMDVLLQLGVKPPIISQPVLVVSTHTGLVELVGFVGKDIKGERPDCKHTDWLMRISMRTDSGNKHTASYEVRASAGSDKTSDFI